MGVGAQAATSPTRLAHLHFATITSHLTDKICANPWLWGHGMNSNGPIQARFRARACDRAAPPNRFYWTNASCSYTVEVDGGTTVTFASNGDARTLPAEAVDLAEEFAVHKWSDLPEAASPESGGTDCRDGEWIREASSEPVQPIQPLPGLCGVLSQAWSLSQQRCRNARNLLRSKTLLPVSSLSRQYINHRPSIPDSGRSTNRGRNFCLAVPRPVA